MNDPKHPYSFWISKKDLEIITKKAKKYTEGNVSAWLRLAAKKYTPKP